jgi:hypothetical protein
MNVAWHRKSADRLYPFADLATLAHVLLSGQKGG